ncbi:STAS/SEC14 domain-containing protein [Pseudalkalibacillus caeni]|uniref:STAS/SEC14 domain-containing protein n=1 Tax=Exobacillus caeni TaxID=2574798 RepID=A0A5R9F994_9BACL|nr:STAS/SEC14 domain-containing protein [Pseudalkalibacillus caeni]TLS37114.1 STAS/SEC14 domain-containing protein [Pseudalkalibacillus caeni]
MISLLPSRSDSAIAIEAGGKITKDDIETFEGYIEESFGDHDDFNCLMIINDDLDGYSIEGLFEDMKLDLEHMSQFNKCAVVSEKNWLEKTTEMGNYLPGIEMKHFNQEETDEAWNWLKQ